MKKLFIFTILVTAALTFTACQSTPDEPVVMQKDLEQMIERGMKTGSEDRGRRRKHYVSGAGNRSFVCSTTRTFRCAGALYSKHYGRQTHNKLRCAGRAARNYAASHGKGRGRRFFRRNRYIRFGKLW